MYESQESRDFPCDIIEHFRTALFSAITQRLIVMP